MVEWLGICLLMQWTVSVLCGIPGPGRSHMLWNNLARMPQLSQCSKEAHKNENAPQCSTKREATARGHPGTFLGRKSKAPSCKLCHHLQEQRILTGYIKHHQINSNAYIKQYNFFYHEKLSISSENHLLQFPTKHKQNY